MSRGGSEDLIGVAFQVLERWCLGFRFEGFKVLAGIVLGLGAWRV